MAVDAAPSGKRTSFGVIAALALLGLILFTIAAAIVLSLIPLYLTSKTATPPAFYRSSPQTAQLPFQSSSTLNAGDTLNAQGRSAVANQLQSAISSSSSFGNNVGVDVQSATIAQQSGRRKRQGTPDLLMIIIFIIELPSSACKSTSCLAQLLAQIRRILASGNIIINVPVGSIGSSTNAPGGTTTIANAITTAAPIDNNTVSNITLISQYWSRLSPYKDNSADAFSVKNIGLPTGCQVEQAHVLQRGGERLPSNDEYQLMNTFASRVAAAKNTFTGPLSYLNTWSLQLTAGGLLAEGVSTEFTAGTSFWTNYGRLLYNAVAGQAFYNATGQNKPVLRTPDTDSLVDSTQTWGKGFFYILNSPESLYTLVTIPSSNGNNTLASPGSCPNYANSSSGLHTIQNTYIDLLPTFLKTGVTRLSTYAPNLANFSATDVFTLQLLCVYEYHAFDSSDACSLFTINEWQGFEYVLDILGYYGYSFGQPAGRALGLGYLQELLARLNNQFLNTSSSSVNSTLDSSASTFSLNQSLFMDMADQSTIVSFLTALSLDYFRQSNLPQSSILTNRTFRLGEMTPFSGHLITEKIGCTSSNPTETNSNRTIYTNTQYGYSSALATNKFVRIRLNNGILPLNTIRGGSCSARTDGLCSLSSFTQGQNNATVQANYQFVCFGSYTYNSNTFNQDGTYFASS